MNTRGESATLAAGRIHVFWLGLIGLSACSAISGLDRLEFDRGGDEGPPSMPGGPENGCESTSMTPDIMAVNQLRPLSLAVDATHIYCANQGTKGGADGSVIRIPLDGTDMDPPPLQDGLHEPMGIAVDASWVYWTNFADGVPSEGSVMKVSLDGSDKPAPLSSGEHGPLGIAVHLDQVIWVNYGGGSLKSLSTTLLDDTTGLLEQPRGITTDGQNIYWTNDVAQGSIGYKAIAGEAEGLIAEEQGFPIAIAAYGGNLYWTSSADGTVMAAPASAGGVAPIELASAQNTPYGIATDGRFVYWTNSGNQGESNGAVMKVAISGGEPPCVVALRQSLPRGIAVDSQYVYWVNEDDGTVMRTEK
jgi:hypothetical protein